MKLLSILLLLALQLAALGAQHISLAWDASPDASVIGYVLYVGTNGPGKYTQVINVGLPLASYDTNAPPPPPPSTTNSSYTVTAANSIYTNGVIEHPHGITIQPCTNTVCAQYGVVYSGLQSGFTYYVMVTAKSAIGESEGSNELAYTVPVVPVSSIQTPILKKY